MQTSFSLAQLANPDIAEADKILRACVHCGFCTATCPTYVLLGDELDSPRGRIYLIKDMLEQGRAAGEIEVKHIDRCLSCLSCMTTCPSGVHYMHLVDQARVHIEKTYARPTVDWWLRRLLAAVLPRPHLFRLALSAARIVRMVGAHRWLPQRLRAMVGLARDWPAAPRATDRPGIFPRRAKSAAGSRSWRVARSRYCGRGSTRRRSAC
ncbi:MAG TPA: 4Fe-4S dicluster domain-containing protein [Dongiaceae bacterium]|nr:4Fe-4S dicluster domain-containing protein [Dongiaceae bacterium]